MMALLLQSLLFHIITIPRHKHLNMTLPLTLLPLLL
jgi:hypothetical protein